MYTLASELAGKGMRVMTTTTTNIYFPAQGETDTLIVSPETPTLLKMVNSAWKQHHRVAVAGRVIGAGKIGGVQAIFFSSRRRHTRFDCDWSSDVCSSD